MEIQGGLIALDDNKHLPIPWQLRAFLGLQTGARAYVGVTRPAAGTPPDVILSPIALSKLPHSFKLIVSHKEERLSFNTVLGIISDYNNVNIAIADSVTIEGRTRHVSTIVLEPSSNPPHGTKKATGDQFRLENYDIAIKKSIDSISSNLNEKFGAETVTSQRITAPSDYLSLYPISIESGFVPNSDWHSRCVAQISAITHNTFDTNKLVCSGNTENCYIRYIFPLKNSTEISLLHIDTPGALESVTSLIGESGYNILSSRLSRTPPRGYGSEVSKFVAVCEPTDTTDNGNWSDLKANLEGRIQGGKYVKYGIDRPRRKDPVPASKSVYFQRPGLKSIAIAVKIFKCCR